MVFYVIHFVGISCRCGNCKNVKKKPNKKPNNIKTYFQIFDDHKRCEIDPARLREGESLNANLVSIFLLFVCYLFVSFSCQINVASLGASISSRQNPFTRVCLNLQIVCLQKRLLYTYLKSAFDVVMIACFCLSNIINYHIIISYHKL